MELITFYALTLGLAHYHLKRHHLYELGHIPKMQLKRYMSFFKKHLLFFFLTTEFKKQTNPTTLIGLFSNYVNQ